MTERVHKLTILGMTCGGCSSRLKQVLEANPEILDVKVSFERDSGVITTTDKLFKIFYHQCGNPAMVKK